MLSTTADTTAEPTSINVSVGAAAAQDRQVVPGSWQVAQTLGLYHATPLAWKKLAMAASKRSIPLASVVEGLIDRSNSERE